MMARTVLFVDTNLHFLRVAIRLLNEHYSNILTIIGVVHGTNHTLEHARLQKPQIIMIDLDGNFANIQLIPQLREILPESGLVILSSHEQQEYCQIALDAGADAFLLKSDFNHGLLPIIYRLNSIYRLNNDPDSHTRCVGENDFDNSHSTQTA